MGYHNYTESCRKTFSLVVALERGKQFRTILISLWHSRVDLNCAFSDIEKVHVLGYRIQNADTELQESISLHSIEWNDKKQSVES